MTSTPSEFSQAHRQAKDEINLIALLNIILESKWLIAGITAICLVIAALYAILSTPIYYANTLLQVEQNQDNNDIMTEMAILFDTSSPVSAEMEILRSRLVVGSTVDQLQLHNSATPDYIPVIGRWLAQRSKELSNPGIFGFGGYVSGAESITIVQLDVPSSLQGKKLKLKATETGYELMTHEQELLVSGAVGEEYSFDYDREKGRVHIGELAARPGAMFTIVSESRLERIKSLQNELGITEKGKQSGVLDISLVGPEPQLIVEILDTLGAAYVAQNVERKVAEAEKSLAFLDTFLPELRQQVQDSEELYTRFRDSQSTYDLSTEAKATLDTTVSLQLQLLELEQKRRELLPQFTTAHPSVRAVDQQIAALNVEIDKLNEQSRRLPELEQQLLNLTRNVMVSSEMYVNLLNSHQQLRLIKEGKVANVRIIDTAEATETPIKPKKARSLLFGLVIGLALGVSAAALRRLLQPSVVDANDIEQSLGLHVMTTMPYSAKQAALHQKLGDQKVKTHILAYAEPEDPAVESLRSLRTALQFKLLESSNNLVLVAGPIPEVGKSFVSLNFAAVLGASDKKVLLIDADLRQGELYRYFNLDSRHHGLSELIQGTHQQEQVIQKNVMPNVDFISTGQRSLNPSELLHSTVESGLLKQLASGYDMVIIDTAPVLAAADSLTLASQAATILMVAKANKTTLGEIEESTKRIQQAGGRVAGVVFNGVRANRSSFGSKYDYYRYQNYNYVVKDIK